MSLKNKTIYTFEEAKKIMMQDILAYESSSVIVRFEYHIKPIDQILWLSMQKAKVKVYGANQEETASIAGIGEAASFYGKTQIDYKKIFKYLRQTLNPQYPYLQWYGGFGFDPKKTDTSWMGFDAWGFIIPRFELARDQSKMIFCCNLRGHIQKKKIIEQLNALQLPKEASPIALNVHNRRDFPDAITWSKGVNQVLKNIHQQVVSKVVLARRTDFDLKNDVNPWMILYNLKKVTPNSYHFAFEFNGRVFLGASPERLYKRFGRTMLSEALAGTKPATVKPEILLESKKDRHEHHIVVGAIKEALQGFCQHLKISTTPSIKKLSNGIHLLTPIEAMLKEGVTDADILQALHPTPALGGKPTLKAMDIIRRLEPFGRGWYGAPVGYVGLDWAEFVVGIRSGLLYKKKLSVFAGAGIVQGSDPSDEWDEIENKISNFFRIIKQ